jgi:hypothetical protein
MKSKLFLWFLLGIGAVLAQAQRAKSANRVAPAMTLQARSEATIASITFLTVAGGAPVQNAGSDQGTLNLGLVFNTRRADAHGVQIESEKDSFVIAARVGLRVDLSNSGRAGSATVSAYLLSPDPSGTVSLDGVQLSLTPGVIARHVAYGAITEHVLKIVVPASMPAGQLLDLIGVIVTPN